MFTMATRKPQEGSGVNTIRSEDCNSVQWTHDPEFGPTEERVSWLWSWVELPETVPGKDEIAEGVFEALTILLACGFWEAIVGGSFDTVFTWFAAVLLIGIGGIGRDDGVGKPSRAAIIWARSW